MTPKTKILIVTESAILPTGMAETIRLIFERLMDQYPNQYELHQIGLFNSVSVTVPRWPVYPTRSVVDTEGRKCFVVNDLYGQETFREIMPQLRPDIVYAHNDPQRVLHLCLDPDQRASKLVLHVNFDGFPMPAGHGPILNRADRIVTLSEFSQRVVLSCLPAIQPEKVDYIYTPADTRRFEPVGEIEKLDLREKWLPRWMPRNAFLLGWIGRNQWRKQVWILYEVIHYLRTGDYRICQSCGRVTLCERKTFLWNNLNDGSRQRTAGGASPTLLCCHCRSPQTTQAEPLSEVFLWLHMPDEASQDWTKSWLEGQFDVHPGRDLHYTEGHPCYRQKHTVKRIVMKITKKCLKPVAIALQGLVAISAFGTWHDWSNSPSGPGFSYDVGLSSGWTLAKYDRSGVSITVNRRVDWTDRIYGPNRYDFSPETGTLVTVSAYWSENSYSYGASHVDGTNGEGSAEGAILSW